jgi:hypothetical protein
VYIIEMDDQQREAEATRHVLSSPLHQERLLGPMGLGKLTWVIMEAQKPGLVPGMVGDVDILAGPMEFSYPETFDSALKEERSLRAEWHPYWHEYLAGKRVAEADGIKWPPTPSYVIGIEVKCSYFDTEPGSTKSSPRKVYGIRKQIDSLLKMGLDRVALLDVIANPPSDGANSQAWMVAAHQARTSLEATREILAGRLPDDSASGHFVWASGSVVGGDESMRGAGVPALLRQPVTNPALAAADEKVLANRRTLLQRIPRLFADTAAPRYFPIVFIDCQECHRLHRLTDGCTAAREAGSGTQNQDATGGCSAT